MTIAEAQQAGVYIRGSGISMQQDMQQAEQKWPVIEFVPSKHATGRHYPRTLISGMCVDVKNADGDPEATRHQVPLILAW